jgi:dethiobiotin synthetase
MLVVVGTGTDVGKTHVVCALARHRGARRVVAYKPVSTGGIDDAIAHAQALGAPLVEPTFSYAPPISPHLAARQAGRPIVVAEIVARAVELGKDALAIVETAGGLLSPLGPGVTNADLVRALLPAKVLLVAADRLGVLHDVTATLGAAELRVDALALSPPAVTDSSTGTNADELAALGIFDDAVVFPRAPLDDPGTAAAAAALWQRLHCR